MTATIFILTTALTLFFFYRALQPRKPRLWIPAWLILTAVLGISGFYQVTGTLPPRFVFLLGPAFLVILYAFLSKSGRDTALKASLKWLTLLHVVRIPVEWVLLQLHYEGLIPDLMTPLGYNYDVLSGISAPIIYYFTFVRKNIGWRGLLVWNILCLLLLINIVTIAILSAETPIQQLAFEQPNVGVTYFPYVWLPALIVPMVMYAHLAGIFQLLKKKDVLTS